MATLASRIRSLDFPITIGGCVEYTGALSIGGYGRLSVSGRSEYAHRYSYMYHIGATNGLQVLHTCDNPKCVNPEHLFLGTHQDNMDDKVAKRRQARGAAGGRSKLSEEDVAFIFQLRRAGLSQTAIGGIVGVSQAQVSNILRKVQWSHFSA